jgi:protein TonB
MHMSDKKNLETPDSVNPVFENKNKAYGAYQLRRSYEKRLTAGLLSTVSFFILLLLGFMKFSPDAVGIVIGDPGAVPHKGNKTIVEPLDPGKIQIIPNEEVSDGRIVVTKKEPKKQDTTKHTMLAMSSTPGLRTGSGTGIGSLAGSDGSMIKVKAPPLKYTPDPETIFSQTYDDPPHFPGGHDAYQAYVDSHINFPFGDDITRSGKIVLSLNIDQEGNIVDVSVLKGIGYGYDEEAVRVIKSMPKWVPGKINGEPARVKCTTTILVHM